MRQIKRVWRSDQYLVRQVIPSSASRLEQMVFNRGAHGGEQATGVGRELNLSGFEHDAFEMLGDGQTWSRLKSFQSLELPEDGKGKEKHLVAVRFN